MIAFQGAFIQDGIASLLKMFIYLTSFWAFLYARQAQSQQTLQTDMHGIYYILGLFCVLGMMVLVSAYSLLTLYLGLELLSLPLYAMVSLNRASYLSTEAGLKYFVMGSVASAVLLFGMSLLYGVTGSLQIDEIMGVLAHQSKPANLMLSFSLVFVVTGLAFKLAAAPFHMWAPDVYQGAPNPVIVLLASAPKLAGFGMLLRLLTEAYYYQAVEWSQLLIFIAVLSMLIGNLVAILQSNFKRMLAYSAIAHTGYLLLGVLTGTPEGYGASLFYVIVYALMSVATFATLIFLGQKGVEIENIQDFKGLNVRHPWFAFLILILMFSLAGIPPTAGFFAKFGVIKSLVDTGHTTLAVAALLFAVIGVFYYLRILTLVYFKAPEESLPLRFPPAALAVLSVNSLLILLMGIFPSFLMNACRVVFGIY